MAKYFIYRNLHRGKAFSIRHKGKVIERSDNITAFNVEFKVNQRGRDRVIKEKSKNVHAFVVCDYYLSEATTSLGERVKYNPYLSSNFIVGDKPIFAADVVTFKDGKCSIHG